MPGVSQQRQRIDKPAADCFGEHIDKGQTQRQF
jgi:hypothetical protein